MVKSHSYGNGFAHTSTQNNSGLPATFYDKKSTTYALNHSFGYDANNNLTTLNDLFASAYNLSLSYDGLDRLDVIHDSYLGAGDVNYDSMGNINYYKLGNKTINYVYTSTKKLDYTTGSKAYDFNYDDKGNVTDNGTRGFIYNAANQMVQSDGYLYTYDGNNKRVKEQGSNGTSYSFYVSNGKLMYRHAGGQHIEYYYLGGKLVANKKGSTITYLHADYLGSTAAESNTSGTVTSRMHYQPFGESIESPKDDIGYTGHKFDTDLGLNYMQARYFDPAIGRFYSNDPVGYTSANPVMSFNRYLYVNNNPYKYTDPNGEFLKLAKMAYNFGKSLIKNKGDVRKSFGEQAESLADNLSTLADGQLTLEDAFAVVDLATGFGDEAKTAVKFAKRGSNSRNSGPQIHTDTSASDAIDNLVDSGYSQKSFPAQNGGTGHLLEKGNKKYEIYPSSTSEGSAAAKVKVNGEVQTSIRFDKKLDN